MPVVGSFSKRVWDWYSVLKEEPSHQVGKRKVFGALMYAFFFAIACFMSGTWFSNKDAATYITYEKELPKGKVYPSHRVPDMITCPSRRKNPKYKFNAFYAQDVIEDILEMPPEDVDELMGMVYKNCPQNLECQPLSQDCEGTKFSGYCAKLMAYGRIFEKMSEWSTKVVNIYRKAILQAQMKKEKKMKLQTLFASLLLFRQMATQALNLTKAEIEENYPKLPNGFRKYGFTFPNCYLYAMNIYGRHRRDREKNIKCKAGGKMIWIGKTLCTVNLGHTIGDYSAPFAGYKIFGEIGIRGRFGAKEMQADYWLGNLDVTTLVENQLNTNIRHNDMVRNRVSAVVNYRMILLVDEANVGKECAPQNIVRGIVLPCRGEKDNVWWYYLFSYQNRPLPDIWIYAKSVDRYVRKASFSDYSRFQLAGGMFGVLVGLSIMQLIELALRFLTWIKPSWQNIAGLLQLILLLAMSIASAAMSAVDTKNYIGSRYATDLSVRDSKMTVPSVRLCDHQKNTPVLGFINNTKFSEFGVSPALYYYLLHAVWRRPSSLSGPFMPRDWKYEKDGKIYLKYPEWVFRNWNPKPQFPWECKHSFKGYFEPKHSRKECFFPNEPLDMMLIRYKFAKTTNATQEESEAYIKDLHQQAQKLYKRMGYSGATPSYAKILDFFNLDLALLLDSCSVGNKRIGNCGNYARYVMDVNHGTCLEVSVPPEAVPRDASLLGLNQGLKITFNTDIYNQYGEQNFYIGPRYGENKIVQNKGMKCVNDFRLNDTSSIVRCLNPGSWHLVLSMPHWSQSSVSLWVSEKGLAAPMQYAIDISDGFEEKIERQGNDCVAEEKLECHQPMEIFYGLSKALLHKKICGCLACYYENPELQKHLDMVVPDQKCCTAEDHWNCYLRLQARLKWNNTATKYEDKVDPKNQVTALLVETRVIPDVRLPGSFEAFEEISKKDLAKMMFYNYGVLDQSTMDRFAEAIQKCTKVPCKKSFLMLNSVQTIDSVPGEWTVTVFYSKNKVHGSTEVDVFEPVGLIGVLICGSSVIFGISLLAILHIIVSSFCKQTNDPVTFRSLMNTLHRYWLRTMGTILLKRNEESQVAPVQFKSDPSATRQRRRETEGTFEEESNLDVPTCSGNLNQNGKVRGQHSGTSSAENSVNSTPSQPEEPAEAERLPEHETTEQRSARSSEDNQSDGELTHRGSQLMLGFLTGVFLLTIIQTALFFQMTNFYMFSADVVTLPVYQRPSLFLCSPKGRQFDALTKALEKGECFLKSKNPPIVKECQKVFKTLLRTKTDHLCWVQDNSNDWHALKEANDFLKITVDKSTEAMFQVMSTNGSSLEKFEPFQKWEESSVLFEYSITQRKLLKNCVEEGDRKNCSLCPQDKNALKLPSACCTERNMKEPTFIDGMPCEQYEFSGGITLQKIGKKAKTKTLSLKPADLSMVVLYGKMKHNFYSLFSILGGLGGAFLGLDLLNLVSHVVFTVADIIGRRRTSRN